MAEVMYHRREVGTFKPPLTLAASELLTLDLSLHKAELGLEAFGLLIVSPVLLNLGKQPPIWEGCDSIVEGEVEGGGAFKEPLEPGG